MEDITKKKIIVDENGRTCLRYYDDESKFWVSIYCNPDNDNGTEYMKTKLKELYLQQLGIHPQNDH